MEPVLSQSGRFHEKRDSGEKPKSLLLLRWCRRGDSNPHGSPHHPLKMACLPGSTTSAREEIHLIHGAAERQAGGKTAESKSGEQARSTGGGVLAKQMANRHHLPG